MKQPQTFSLIFALCFGLLQVTVVLGQTSIIVTNADASFQPNLSSSSNLKVVLTSVTNRVASEFSDALRVHPLTHPESSFQTLLDQTLNRVNFDFAQANRLTTLQFPMELVNDKTPPQIQGEVSAQVSGGSATLHWTTAEFTIATLRYGTQPGNLPGSQSVTAFAKEHSVSLPDVTPGAVIYLQIALTDLSGNTFATPERSMTISQNRAVYLPVVRR